MKTQLKTVLAAGFIFIASNFSFAQTTAMDFNTDDCNGTNQHLFTELDAGNAVIIEFFMNSCSSCITAGGKLETMKAALLAQYPGKIKAYTFGYVNSYSCTLIKNWVTTNGFTSTPMDSGAMQVAYYGGFGMPTIVILGGGTNHSVLGNPYIGFTTSDTTTMANDIRNFLNTTVGVNSNQNVSSDIKLFPNPSSEFLDLSLNVAKTSSVSISITDLTGRKLENVSNNENLGVGLLTKKINTSHLVQGSYLMVITLNDKTEIKKFSIIK